MVVANVLSNRQMVLFEVTWCIYKSEGEAVSR